MSELVKSQRGGLIRHARGREGNLVDPSSPAHEIFLFETRIAGTPHIENIAQLEPRLNIGDKLHFYREQDNIFSNSAIAVETESRVKIGYVPQADNAVFSRLMDAGKLLYARIAYKEMIENWLKIDIRVFLQE